jgi:excinuclease ABC subunit B
VLDADKEGFLRSEVSLVQTIGRAARNVNGRVILYADAITASMRKALDETNRRRAVQRAYNEEHGITPQTVKRNISDLGMAVVEADYVTVPISSEDGAEYQPEQIPAMVEELERDMHRAAEELEFEKAARLRDRILALKDLQLGVKRSTTGTRGLLGSGANLAMGDVVGRARGPRRPAARRRRR